MRFKNRYLIAGIYGSDNLSISPTQSLERHLRKICLEMFGYVGGAVAVQSLAIKYFNNNVLVVRCRREDVMKIRALLTFISEINQQPCMLRVLTTSGCVRTCRVAVKNIQSDWHRKIDSTMKMEDEQLIREIEH